MDKSIARQLVEKTTKRAQEVIKHRNEFQEKNFPNLGSIFATKTFIKI